MPTSIIGNSTCSSPYDAGAGESIVVKRTGAIEGHYYELAVPTNIVTTSNGSEIAMQSQGWQIADANGDVEWVFNASLSDPVVDTTIANGWVLPAGEYQMTTRDFEDKTGATVEAVMFTISGGSTTAAISKATKNKKSQSKGNPH